MKIGNVEIASRLALAPMAGVTDLAFRAVCRRLGAGYTVTEMVSAKALCYQDKKTLPLLRLGEEEHPAAIQLFGSDVRLYGTGRCPGSRAFGADVWTSIWAAPSPSVQQRGWLPAWPESGGRPPG